MPAEHVMYINYTTIGNTEHCHSYIQSQLLLLYTCTYVYIYTYAAHTSSVIAVSAATV